MPSLLLFSSKETIEITKNCYNHCFLIPKNVSYSPFLYIFLVVPDRICMRDREIISLAALPTPSQCKYLYFLTFSLLAGQLCIVLPFIQKAFLPFLLSFDSILAMFAGYYTVGLFVTFNMRCTIVLVHIEAQIFLKISI